MTRHAGRGVRFEQPVAAGAIAHDVDAAPARAAECVERRERERADLFFGGAVEFSSASIHLSNAIRELHAAFEEQGARTENRGKVPVVSCTGSEPMKDKYGTNYRPKLEIVKWVDRPDDLPDASPVDEADVWKGAAPASKPAQYVPPPAAKAAAEPLAEPLF